ncbi:MAG: hypothetical protein RLZZ623_3544, partial [Actinomycetota bacterium]
KIHAVVRVPSRPSHPERVNSHRVGETAAMGFGQQSGPPASAKQVQELVALLQAAGHSDFRDARGPMGFTQRQAGGKFTRDEADAFIEQLQAEQERSDTVEDVEPVTKLDAKPASRPAARPASRPSAADQSLRGVSTERLAAELQRRGWIVVEP